MPEFNFWETIARNGFLLARAIIHLVKCVRLTKPRGEIRHCLHDHNIMACVAGPSGTSAAEEQVVSLVCHS